jgi:iron complex transport system substrate-binding protein
MRIASLVPSATEMLYALGLGDSVVAVTHECDYPPEAASLPHLTKTVLPDGLSAAEIDRTVKARVAEGQALYELDEELLASLAPDLIRLGETAEIPRQAHELRGELEGRLATVRAAVAGASLPRVIALEWLDPPYVGGHWVPEMISIAGGEDVAGPPGLKSPEVSWGELSGLNPDVAIAMPCGWYVEDSRAQALAYWDQIEQLGAQRVFAVDAASTFSRPGPRLIDGVELLGHLLHPDLVDSPGNIGFAEVREPSVWRGAGG